MFLATGSGLLELTDVINFDWKAHCLGLLMIFNLMLSIL